MGITFFQRGLYNDIRKSGFCSIYLARKKNINNQERVVSFLRILMSKMGNILPKNFVNKIN